MGDGGGSIEAQRGHILRFLAVDQTKVILHRHKWIAARLTRHC